MTAQQSDPLAKGARTWGMALSAGPRILVRSLLLCSLWLCGVSTGQATELLLYTEENPPLNFSRGEQPTGFATEIIEQLAARTGDTVRIELGPWTRGYSKAMNERNVGVFSTARIAERETHFQWVGPLTQTLNRFYTRKGSGLQVASLEAAQARRLVLPRQWYSYEYLATQGFRNIYTVTSAEKMMQMFSKGRADTLAVSDIALPGLLAMVGMTPDQVEPQFVFLQHESYLAFSPATDQAVVARWQLALDELKRDGSFTSTFQRWFPHQDVPPRLIEASR
ncbi:ABC transporter substrate-binding protein [Pseudomonas sp. SA3-5]|uniref:ABC transporter substrate-binding protein n=1 Tax=Pseudomonas aestuarii TaxID=3018340 RepID=A0ABT4XB52_9PSED|nr:ABC transporter substrate-binding protein [Pseudomonas aestuarii]MDA7084993.1 ABC transporter substrate-binding protein [Pseudomonas aestuarii]